GKYSGFGGTDYERVQHELREILASFPNSGDEPFVDILFNQIITTTKNAYYTPHDVISAIYAQLGFVSGRVLEPSMGIGNFFAAMPESLRHNTQRVGIELDSVSAKIAQYLHPNARVENMNFEEFSDSLGFDLVIGNPPYEGKMNGMPIAAAFVKKSLELTKENGIVVQVVSNSFLDNPASAHARAAIAKEAELLGAVRLPSDTFSGTSVATDIVVFQKKRGGGSHDFVGTGNHSDGAQSLSLNNYYLQHPKNVLGELRVRDTNFQGKRWSVESNESIASLPHVLEAIFKNRVGSSDAIIENATEQDLRRYTGKARNGSLVSVGDKMFVVSAGDRFSQTLNSIDWLEKINQASNKKPFEELSDMGKKRRLQDAKDAESMAKDYISLRDSLESLRKAEMSNDSKMDTLREQLQEGDPAFKAKRCNGGK
ncbi:MAG: N-6 DNA methylase, partial [Helicobacter sp.]|nr:N-6 DNA methylase [Helicobacter sp.]